MCGIKANNVNRNSPIGVNVVLLLFQGGARELKCQEKETVMANIWLG